MAGECGSTPQAGMGAMMFAALRRRCDVKNPAAEGAAGLRSSSWQTETDHPPCSGAAPSTRTADGGGRPQGGRLASAAQRRLDPIEVTQQRSMRSTPTRPA